MFNALNYNHYQMCFIYRMKILFHHDLSNTPFSAKKLITLLSVEKESTNVKSTSLILLDLPNVFYFMTKRCRIVEFIYQSIG